VLSVVSLHPFPPDFRAICLLHNAMYTRIVNDSLSSRLALSECPRPALNKIQSLTRIVGISEKWRIKVFHLSVLLC
jgi:hypothetical protein